MPKCAVRPLLGAFTLAAASAGAARLRVVEDTGTPMARLHPVQTVLMAVFQYFVGNTDWSGRALHNIILLADSVGNVTPVPYEMLVSCQ